MRNLAPGETVLLEVRPHWWYLAGPVALLAATIAGAIAALVEHVPGWADWPILGVLLLAALWLVGRYLRWVTTRLVVTSSRIIDRRGVLGRAAREVPLSAVSDIGYHQSIFERVIGAGDVLIESAGSDGQEVFPDLPHPATIHNEIFTAMQHGRSGYPAAPAGIPEQIDQLDRLRRRGAITEEEFAAKKADLLDRL